jgi:glycosyltransferase involved in cell wall biosynthesis
MTKPSTVSPKIALVYDRVNTPFGGAEQVLLALHQLYPDAPLYTAVYDPERAKWADVFKVRVSFLSRWSLVSKFHRAFAWLMPLAFESFDFSKYDILISITSAEAKGIITLPHQLHLCYLLTPTRYLWSHAEEYQQDAWTGWLRALIFGYLKWWDRAAAARPDAYVPISQLVQERTHRFYKRQTLPVIYPPLSQEFYNLAGQDQTAALLANFDLNTPYYLIVARLVPYKRIDLAIEACGQLNKRLVVIGQGPDLERLQQLAAQTQAAHPNSRIEFVQAVQPQQIVAYYQRCAGFLAPGEEDFGITVLESQAAGKPVIVAQTSGAAETVQAGKTGILLSEQTPAALAAAILQLENTTWESQKIRAHVQQYLTHEFTRQFSTQVEKSWAEKGKYV